MVMIELSVPNVKSENFHGKIDSLFAYFESIFFTSNMIWSIRICKRICYKNWSLKRKEWKKIWAITNISRPKHTFLFKIFIFKLFSCFTYDHHRMKAKDPKKLFYPSLDRKPSFIL